ncbi:hypothetical protein EZS27_020567 [termite gut metagenome]|uniref:Uncharacterized protein n=1 Tax=termite gut metagenome TaxID=433724 RepID=A0A5J4RB21_9ZZZZ
MPESGEKNKEFFGITNCLNTSNFLEIYLNQGRMKENIYDLI